jgi:hypothetical protein
LISILIKETKSILQKPSLGLKTMALGMTIMVQSMLTCEGACT